MISITDLTPSAELTLHTLRSAKFIYPTPFQLALSPGLFTGQQVLRFVPNKRLVAFGTWQGKPVVGKIFFGKNAAQHYQNEIAGIQALQSKGIPTPAIFKEITCHDPRIKLLCIERLFGIQTLEEVLLQKKAAPDQLAFLKIIMQQFVTLHQAGLVQGDPHLKNFLLMNNTIFMIDGSRIQMFAGAVPKQESLHNLGLFFSLLGPAYAVYQAELYTYYAEIRQWPQDAQDFGIMQAAQLKLKQEHLARLTEKIFSTSRDYISFKTSNRAGMINRAYASPALIDFLHQPQTVHQHTGKKCLSTDKQVTQLQVTFDARDYLIKCYHQKTYWQQSRAAKEWQLNHELHFLGKLQSKPVAFLEKKFLGITLESFFILEMSSAD